MKRREFFARAAQLFAAIGLAKHAPGAPATSAPLPVAPLPPPPLPHPYTDFPWLVSSICISPRLGAGGGDEFFLEPPYWTHIGPRVHDYQERFHTKVLFDTHLR